MDRHLLFEGKTSMGGREVDIKIYKLVDSDTAYYEWDYNPHLVDESQMDVHIGQINRAEDLESLLFRIKMYRDEIRKIKRVVPNPNF